MIKSLLNEMKFGLALSGLAMAIGVGGQLAAADAAEARPMGVSPALHTFEGSEAPDWVGTVRPFGLRHGRAIHASDGQCFDLDGRSLRQRQSADGPYWTRVHGRRALVGYDRVNGDFISMSNRYVICALWEG